MDSLPYIVNSHGEVGHYKPRYATYNHSFFYEGNWHSTRGRRYIAGYEWAASGQGRRVNSSLIAFASEHTDAFDGFWGKARYFLLGPNVGNGRYDINGNYQGPALITGMAPSPGFAKMSPGLQALIREGVKGNSIINIRNTLLNSGFTQTLSNNKSGYLFINKAGEQVRIMSRRNGGWDVRIMNQYGNYLDDIGRVALPGSSHGITVFPW